MLLFSYTGKTEHSSSSAPVLDSPKGSLQTESAVCVQRRGGHAAPHWSVWTGLGVGVSEMGRPRWAVQGLIDWTHNLQWYIPHDFHIFVSSEY